MSNPYIVGYTTDNVKVITIFSSLSFTYGDENEYIEYFGTQSGDNYEEMLIEMDVYNLLHGKEILDEICAADVKTDNALKKRVKELAEENKQLKLKLKQLKTLIDK